MWFGTQDGLNRYDGYSIKTFKNDPSDPKSLTDNFIFAIYIDPAGKLYVETQNGFFQRYDARTESFSVLKKDSLDLTNFKVNRVSAVLEEPDTHWLGSLGSETGLKRTNKKTGEVTIFKHDPLDPESISDNKVYSIFRDRSGNLWVGTFNGLDKLNEKTEKFTHYRNDPNNPKSLSDNWVWPIFQDSKGIIWVGTVRGGLNRFDPQKNTFKSYKNDPSDPTSINDNFIFSIYQGNGGLIWVGTNTGGVNFFNPATRVFEHYSNNPNDKNSLSDDAVISMCVDKDGMYWIGTRSGGLDKFNYKKKTFKNYTHDPSNPQSLVSNSIAVIYPDRSGILWLGTFSNGLMAFDPRNETYNYYQNIPSDSNSLSDNRIYSVLEDEDGIIWIGTYGGGLNRLDRKTGKISCYKSDKNDSTSLSSNSVWSIAEDNDGNLWLGTFGGGINIFDRRNANFKHLKNIPDDPTSLMDDNIIVVFKDSKGNLWMGTTKGLSGYNKEKNNFRNYSEKNGLANNFVFGITEDNKGNLWLSTNNGLSKFNPGKETFKNYYAEDGLQSNEFNQNAYAKDTKTGRMLFGGINGFNVFNPDSIKGNTYVPQISFTNYIRYNTDHEEGKPIIEKGIADRDSISITYKDNIITLQFAALSYYNNLENQYRYKLEGFNENWIQLGNEHSVTFTNLSPGDYTLRVIGSNNDGVWNNTGKSLFVEVTPPWWRTNIAYAIYVIIFLSSLYGIRRFEINRREQKARLRENQLLLKATEAEKRAIQIENDRKTKELEEARQLQLSMLPKELPKLPNLQIAAFMRTATEVGGDYYDFNVQENGILNVGFGDATGHGLQAGTMVTLMKGFFTSDAAKLEPLAFMNHCSNMIKEIKLGRILMSFSLLRFIESNCVITSAGMPPVYFYNKDKKETEEVLIQGMPLGAMRKFSYSIIEKKLKSGDTILLLSDGLAEQMNNNNEMVDYPRIKNHFNEIAENSPDEIIKSLVALADNWMNGVAQADDISLIVLKVV
jgi:ligand-binding sensor domain-containing protein/serine phosphatase RsbU (regulator of sigma subunit)